MFPNPDQLFFSSFCLFTSTHGSLRNILPPPKRRAAFSGRYVLHTYSAESSLLASCLWTQGCVVKVAPLRGSSAYVGSGSTKVEPLCIHVWPTAPAETVKVPGSASANRTDIKGKQKCSSPEEPFEPTDSTKFSYSDLCFWEDTHCTKWNGTNQLKLIKAAFHLDHVFLAPSPAHTVSLENLCYSKRNCSINSFYMSLSLVNTDLTLVVNVAWAVTGGMRKHQ